jgi:hypothetical protein
MIHRGRSVGKALFLESKNGTLAASGDIRADFGYRLGAPSDPDADGVWAEWAYEHGRLQLNSDRLGFYPMFYREDRDGIAVSDDLVRLVRPDGSMHLDDAAIAVFLRSGFFVGDDTPFRDIRAVPPGAVLTRDAHGLRLRAHALAAPPRSSLSRDAAVREYGPVFRDTMAPFAAAAGPRFAVALSGGRDSRHILLALLAAERRPTACLTASRVPPAHDEDAEIASMVAGISGIEHVVLPRVSDLLGAELAKNLATGFCADEHSWLLSLAASLQENAFPTTFDGIGGDVLSAGLFLDEERLRLYQRGALRELADSVLGPEHHLASMLRPAYYERWGRERAIARLIPELEKHARSPNPVGQFFFWNRTRREIALCPWRMLNRAGHVFAPYLSRPAYEFLASLPAEHFLDHSFHTEAITRAYPWFARVPFETHARPPARHARASIARYARDVARYCLAPRDARRRLDPLFYLPRIAKGLLDARYGTELHHLFNKAVFVTQLERLREGRPER